MKLMNMISKTAKKTVRYLKRHTPEILTAAGVAATTGGAIWIARRTIDAADILDEHKESIEEIKTLKEEGTSYQDDDAYRHDISHIYVDTTKKLVKNYTGPVLTFASGLGCLVGVNVSLKKKCTKTLAMYFGQKKLFDTYRNNVVNRFGEDVDYDMLHGTKTANEKVEVTDENGNVRKEKRSVKVKDDKLTSIYGFFFDEGCAGWSNSEDYNKSYASIQNTVLYDELQRKGSLTLYKVWKAFGYIEYLKKMQNETDDTEVFNSIEHRIEMSKIVGWKYDKKSNTYYNDKMFNLGLDPNSPSSAMRRFMKGLEKNVFIEPNVAGTIFGVRCDNGVWYNEYDKPALARKSDKMVQGLYSA